MSHRSGPSPLDSAASNLASKETTPAKGMVVILTLTPGCLASNSGIHFFVMASCSGGNSCVQTSRVWAAAAGAAGVAWAAVGAAGTWAGGAATGVIGTQLA